MADGVWRTFKDLDGEDVLINLRLVRAVTPSVMTTRSGDKAMCEVWFDERHRIMVEGNFDKVSAKFSNA